jgi:hypothetical protein
VTAGPGRWDDTSAGQQDLIEAIRYSGEVRPPLVAVFAVLWSSCAAPPPAAESKPGPDPTSEDWYSSSTQQLADVVRQGEQQFKASRFDDAAATVQKGQTLQSRLLTAPHPTLAAVEAASDLDDLYGRMLLRNGHIGYARSTFQKNVIRWKNWKPQTPETERRWKAAVAAVAECDRRL